MEIKNDFKEKHSFFFTKPIKKYRHKIKDKKTLSVLSLLIIAVVFLIFFGAASFFYGVHMYYTGRYYPLRMLAYRMVQGDFSFIKNKSVSTYSQIDNFKIDIKFKDFEKIRFLREKAVKQRFITNDLQEEIPAKIMFNNESYKVSLSLTGLIVEHFQHPEKWSLSVKVKGNKTILGMREFALLVPTSRGYLTDWIAHKILKSRNVIGNRCDFIDVDINGKNLGVYYLEERFDKLLIENNEFREGIIFKISGTDLNAYNGKKINKNPELSEKLFTLNKLWYSFLSGKITSGQLFDLKKLASVAAVSDLMNQKHPLYFSNMRFYFNPLTGLVEPIPREWGFLTKESKQPFEALLIEDPNSQDASAYHKGLYDDALIMKIYNNSEFDEYYLKEIDLISDKAYLDSIMALHLDERNSFLGKIYKENPFYEYPIEILHRRQKSIREKIRPATQLIESVYSGFENDSLHFHIYNKEDLPIEIHYLTYNSQKMIFPLKRILVAANYKTINKEQNISFYYKNDDETGVFAPEKLEIYYSILGIDDIKRSMVFSKKLSEEEYSVINPTRSPQNLTDFPFLAVNDSLKAIEFSEQKCIIGSNLHIPEGYSVIAKSGCNIDLINSSKIISYSPLLFFGTKEEPIEVTSSDSTGQGIVVLNCERTSEFSYVNFRYLSNISDKGYSLPSAVTFYESPVNLSNCNFYDNLRGDDYLNIFRTNFIMSECSFVNAYADAFDGDFCEGTIENTNFLGSGNDAVDVSGSNILLKNIHIKNAADKGLSSGEKSQMIVKGIIIENSEIAVCSKDKSLIDIKDVEIKSCEIGFTAYQKKPEFGPSSIIAMNANTHDVNLPFLIETNSSLTIDGEKKVSDVEKVKELMYGVIYGKASK